MDMHTLSKLQSMVVNSRTTASTEPDTSETESSMKARAFSFSREPPDSPRAVTSIWKAIDEPLVNKGMKEFLNITDN